MAIARSAKGTTHINIVCQRGAGSTVTFPVGEFSSAIILVDIYSTRCINAACRAMALHAARYAFYLSIKDDGPSPVKGNFRPPVSLSGVDDDDDSDASMRGPSINEALPLPLPLSPINAYPVPVLPLL